jgi:hypothetical protein
MAELHFTVDTTPMAHSVDSAKGHLNGVTVAVTAMEAAVIAAERESSKTICQNVDEGFYMLVKSQISQKAVAAYSEMSSKQMTLVQLARALENVKRQMENDYNMITRRYAKLFQSLNKALETRVKEIDKPAMQLAEIRKSMVFDKLINDSSAVFSISAEALPLAQTALSGKLKQKTKDTLNTLSEAVYESRSYSEKVDSILIKNEINACGEGDICFVPAVLLVTDSLINTDGSIENVYTAEANVWQNTAVIVSELNLIQKDLNWMPLNNEEKAMIRNEFLALCEKESGEERLLQEMIRLFDESAWEDCIK